jgi:hypothetical protein
MTLPDITLPDITLPDEFRDGVSHGFALKGGEFHGTVEIAAEPEQVSRGRTKPLPELFR